MKWVITKLHTAFKWGCVVLFFIGARGLIHIVVKRWGDYDLVQICGHLVLSGLFWALFFIQIEELNNNRAGRKPRHKHFQL